MASKHCPKCGASLHGRKAQVYISRRKDGREERTCRPCKLATVSARHYRLMQTDPEYAERMHHKFLAYHDGRRQRAIASYRARMGLPPMDLSRSQ